MTATSLEVEAVQLMTGGSSCLQTVTEAGHLIAAGVVSNGDTCHPNKGCVPLKTELWSMKADHRHREERISHWKEDCLVPKGEMRSTMTDLEEGRPVLGMRRNCRTMRNMENIVPREDTLIKLPKIRPHQIQFTRGLHDDEVRQTQGMNRIRTKKSRGGHLIYGGILLARSGLLTDVKMMNTNHILTYRPSPCIEVELMVLDGMAMQPLGICTRTTCPTVTEMLVVEVMILEAEEVHRAIGNQSRLQTTGWISLSRIVTSQRKMTEIAACTAEAAHHSMKLAFNMKLTELGTDADLHLRTDIVSCKAGTVLDLV